MIITIVITFTSNDVLRGKQSFAKNIFYLFVSGSQCDFSNSVDCYNEVNQIIEHNDKNIMNDFQNLLKLVLGIKNIIRELIVRNIVF